MRSSSFRSDWLTAELLTPSRSPATRKFLVSATATNTVAPSSVLVCMK